MQLGLGGKDNPCDGLLLFMCGHGSMGTFIACDDPSPLEKDEKQQRRISLTDIHEFFNNRNARALANRPKIFFKVACRGQMSAEVLRIEVPTRAGHTVMFVHPFAEMVTIYASMPHDAIFDTSGEGKGSYLAHVLHEVLTHEEWRHEALDSMVLRMRRGVGHKSGAREWVQVEASHSRPMANSQGPAKNIPGCLVSRPTLFQACR